MTRLKVLVYNVAANYPGVGDYARMDKLRIKLIEGDYDFIGLSEVYNQSMATILLDDVNLQKKYPYIEYLMADYTDLALPYHTFHRGLVLISKYPFVQSEHFTYTDRMTEGLNRLLAPKDVLYCRFQHPDTEIDVFMTHLQWGDLPLQVEVRKKHFVELRQKVDEWHNPETPTLILGDLNIYGYPDKSDEYSTFADLFVEFTDPHYTLHPSDPAKTWTGDNAKVFNWYDGSKFDYIFVSEHFTPLTSEVLRWKGRSGPYILKWKPTHFVSRRDRVNIFIKRLLRIAVLPIHLLLMAGLTIYRIRNGYPQILVLVHKDLSDHYALQADLEMND
ncbi:MAG: endonuclease/exonuclease/phosphatase family protein [Candidatus Kariarchaeaceae archaeon]